MNQTMIAAAVSMNGFQQKLDIIADNVANVNTKGYKRKTASFADVLTNVQQHNEDFQQPGRVTPMGYTLGYGSMLTGLSRDMSQGSLQHTGVSTDVALQGNALFEVGTPTGTAWMREGSFHYIIDGDERILTSAEGHPVMSANDTEIRIPAGYEMKIDEAGRVFGVKTGEPDEELGQMKVVRPLKPELLVQMENNLFVLPQGADRNTFVETLNLTGDRSDPNAPHVNVMQGMLEESNVSMVDEMAELMQAQRAYQLASRALISGDAMSELANNLRA